VAYLLWLVPRPRAIGRNGWQVPLPNCSLTLIQIGIGLADLGLSALAMYVLISAYAPVDLVSTAVAYVLGALLGFASHAPGSLGVFDAAMLLALPQVEKEQLLAALLIFRCLYFLVPFAVALSAFGVWELWIPVPRERAKDSPP
jgi:glycosyltransferase 2 family protein